MEEHHSPTGKLFLTLRASPFNCHPAVASSAISLQSQSRSLVRSRVNIRGWGRDVGCCRVQPTYESSATLVHSTTNIATSIGEVRFDRCTEQLQCVHQHAYQYPAYKLCLYMWDLMFSQLLVLWAVKPC